MPWRRRRASSQSAERRTDSDLPADADGDLGLSIRHGVVDRRGELFAASSSPSWLRPCRAMQAIAVALHRLLFVGLGCEQPVRRVDDRVAAPRLASAICSSSVSPSGSASASFLMNASSASASPSGIVESSAVAGSAGGVARRRGVSGAHRRRWSTRPRRRHAGHDANMTRDADRPEVRRRFIEIALARVAGERSADASQASRPAGSTVRRRVRRCRNCDKRGSPRQGESGGCTASSRRSGLRRACSRHFGRSTSRRQGGNCRHGPRWWNSAMICHASAGESA